MVLAAMAPGSLFDPYAARGCPKQESRSSSFAGLVCLDTLAVLPCPTRSTAVLNILTISVQRFDAQPAFGTLTVIVREAALPGTTNALLVLTARIAA